MHRDKRQPVVECLERRFLMSVTYNRTAAVAYATQYANEVVGDGYFWTTTGDCVYYGAGQPAPTGTGLDDGIGDDCAHFVSSCIGAPPGGGGGGLPVYQPFAGNSNSAYAAQYGDPSAPGLDSWLVSSGYAQLLAKGSVTSSTIKNDISQMQPGDVIGYDWDNDGTIDHTVMYLGNNLIAAHAASELNVSWNSFGSSGYTVYLYHITVPGATAPATPTNSLPANNAVVSTTTPTLSASAFSESGASQAAAEWEIFNGSTLVYDTGTDTTDKTTLTVPTGKLSSGNTYTWEVRYEDNQGHWSTYSTATSFTVASASLLTLSGSSNYYLENTANSQSLNVWDNTTPAGNPSQTVALSEITTIIIDGTSTGSNITLDFTNGGMSPQHRLTIFGAGSSANNVLSVIGSTGNDVVDYQSGQFIINGTLVAYNGVGTFGFTPGAGTDSVELDAGTLSLGATASGTVGLSSLSIQTGAALDIGSDIVNLSYTAGNDPEATIESLISSGYNNGLWNGSGIISSAAAANPQTSAVGFLDTGSQITFRATWKGDANLDGVVNADDLSIMALGQTQHKTDWAAGNFNYDTQINADDWIIFNYAVAYSNGRNYSNVFAPGAELGSSMQMSQLLNTSTL